MPDLWMDVDVALSEVPVNIMPLIDATTFVDIEDAVAYNAGGLALVWHFFDTAGNYNNGVAVTPTNTGGLHDWVDHGTHGIYTIEIPASGGTINNDTEGFGYFTGKATGILPWRGPVIGFRAAALNDALIDGGDNLDVNVTQFGGTNGTFASGRPEVNTSHVAGTAQTAGDLTLLLSEVATTLDGLIIAEGLIGTTGTDTTHVQLPGAAWADDKINDMLLVLYDAGDTEQRDSRWIDDWVLSSELATVETLTFTPDASTYYWLLSVRRDVETSTGFDAAVLAAVGLASANLDTQLAALPTAVENRAEMDSNSTQLAAIVADTSELQTDWVNGGRLDLIVDAILDDTDLIDDGTSGLAKIATDVAAILVDTGTTLPGTLSDLAGATFNTATDSLEALRNRGDVAWITAAGFSTHDAAAVVTALGTGSTLTSLATAAALTTVDGIVDDILVDTAVIGALGAGLTAIIGADGDTLKTLSDQIDGLSTASAPQLLQNTTIATLASQTSFTLTAGSADNDAYNGAIVVVTDQSTATQKAVGSVLDYVGSTKTITLSADPGIFTMAVGDTVDILAAIGSAPTAAAIRAEMDSNSTQLAAIVADTNELQANQGNWLTATGFSTHSAADVITAMGTGTFLSAIPWNAAWDTEVQSECTDALNAYDPPTNTEMVAAFTEIKGSTWASTDTLENIRDEQVVIDGIVDSILVDTAEIGAAGAGLTNINLPNQTMDIVGNITGNLSGSVGSVTGAINTAAGTITTLDALDTAQDSQHSTTQAAIADVPTVAEFEARTLVAANYFDPAADTVAHVTLVDTTTTNTDMLTAAAVNAEVDTALSDVGLTTTITGRIDRAISAIVTTAMTESYAADGAAPTLTQAIMLIMQRLTEFAISGTDITVKKLDGSTTAAVLSMDDTADAATSSTRSS